MVNTKVFGAFIIGSSPIEVTINNLLWCNGSTDGSNPLSVGSNPTGRTKIILYGREYKDSIREITRTSEVYRFLNKELEVRK